MQCSPMHIKPSLQLLETGYEEPEGLVSAHRKVSWGTKKKKEKGYKCIWPPAGLISEVTRCPEQTCCLQFFPSLWCFNMLRFRGFNCRGMEQIINTYSRSSPVTLNASVWGNKRLFVYLL